MRKCAPKKHDREFEKEKIAIIKIVDQFLKCTDDLHSQADLLLY